MQPQGDVRLGGEVDAGVQEIFRRQQFESPSPVDATESVSQGDHPTLILRSQGLDWLLDGEGHQANQNSKKLLKSGHFYSDKYIEKLII